MLRRRGCCPRRAWCACAGLPRLVACRGGMAPTGVHFGAGHPSTTGTMNWHWWQRWPLCGPMKGHTGRMQTRWPAHSGHGSWQSRQPARFGSRLSRVPRTYGHCRTGGCPLAGPRSPGTGCGRAARSLATRRSRGPGAAGSPCCSSCRRRPGAWAWGRCRRPGRSCGAASWPGPAAHWPAAAHWPSAPGAWSLPGAWAPVGWASDPAAARRGWSAWPRCTSTPHWGSSWPSWPPRLRVRFLRAARPACRQPWASGPPGGGSP